MKRYLITLLLCGAMLSGARGYAATIELPKLNYEIMYDDVAMTAQFVELSGDRPTKFQEFSETVSGPQGLKEIIMIGVPKTPQYVYFEGTDMFRRDQNVFVEWGKTGSYKVSFEFNQIPHRFSENSRTIEQDPTTGVYTVDRALRADPNGLNGGTYSERVRGLVSTFTERDLEIQRDQYKWRFSSWLNENLEAALNAGYEEREGLRKIGTGTYIRTGETFEIRGIELPEPIDYQTLDIGARLTYAVPKSVTSLDWAVSYFHNRVDALIWDNPFRITDALATGAGGTANRGRFEQGRLALPPDNIANTITLSQAWTLPAKTTFTGALSYGIHRQDETFLPYTSNNAINGGLANAGRAGFVATDLSGLPQLDLDGTSHVFTQSYKLVNRAIDRLKAKAYLNMYDYMNSSDSIVFPGYAAFSDSWWLTNIAGEEIINRPPSFVELKTGPELEYELNKMVTLETGYQYGYRHLKNRQVNDIDEHTFRNGIEIRPLKEVKIEGDYSYGWRTYRGNYFSHREFTQLRMFDQANRDRNQLHTRLETTPLKELTFGAAGTWGFDDYKLDYGLKRNTNTNFSLDAQYVPSEKMSCYTYYAWDKGRFDIVSLSKTGAYEPNNTWFSDTTQLTNTLGVGSEYSIIPGKVTADMGYSLSLGTEKIMNRDGLQRPDNPISATAFDWPAVHSFWHQAKCQVKCKIRKDLELRAYYQFEIYKQDDFAWDGLQPYMQGQLVDNSTQYLWLDSRYGDYTAHVFGFSLRYIF